MLYKLYLDPNTVYEEGDDYWGTPSTPGTSTPVPTGTPQPSTTPGQSGLSFPALPPSGPSGQVTDANGNIVDYGDNSSDGVNATLSMTELNALGPDGSGLLSWSEINQILQLQASGVKLDPAMVADLKIQAAQAQANTSATAPKSFSLDLTPSTDEKGTIGLQINSTTGELWAFTPAGQVVQVFAPLGAASQEGLGERYGYEVRGDQIWRTDRYGYPINITEQVMKRIGADNVAALVAGGSGPVDPYAGMTPEQKNAAIYDATIATGNKAMNAFAAGLPEGTKIFKTGELEGFYYDAKGNKIPVAYVPDRGRVEQGQPVSGTNFVQGPQGFTAVTNPGRSAAIKEAMRKNGAPALTPEQSAVVSALGPVQGAEYAKEVLGLDYVPTLSDLIALKGAGSVAGPGSDLMKWAITQDPETLLRLASSGTRDPQVRANIEAAAARAYPNDPARQQAWIASFMAGRGINTAFQKLLNPDPIDGISSAGVKYLTGEGYSYDEATGNWVSGSAKSWNSETHQWDAQTLSRSEAAKQARNSVYDDASLAQTMATSLDQAKGLGYGIVPSRNGWAIQMPDGTLRGGYTTQEEAESALSIMIYRMQQQEIEKMTAPWDQPGWANRRGILKNPPKPTIVPRREELVSDRPGYNGPSYPHFPPPTDPGPTTPPVTPPAPPPEPTQNGNPYLPVYAFDEGGSVRFPMRSKFGRPIFNPNVKLDPSQVKRVGYPSMNSGFTFQQFLENMFGNLWGFANGGSVNTAMDVGQPGGQPHLTLDEPAVLTGMETGRPYAVAAEAGTKELVNQTPDGGLNFTPTNMPMSGQQQPEFQMPVDPVAEAKKKNDWQRVAVLTGQPLSKVLRDAAKERSRPRF